MASKLACQGTDWETSGRRTVYWYPPGIATAVIVSGLPGSGKTTMAFPLCVEIDAALLSKDTIHETLFDALSITDRQSSLRIGKASVDVMYALAAHSPYTVMDNFWRYDEAKLQLPRLGLSLIQVHCACPPLLAMDRYRTRAPSRHRAHFEETVVYDSREVWFTEPNQPLEIPGPILSVDTTRSVDIPAVARWVRQERASLESR
jgi:tRNA uridine 5-carbamoylmethylation protein Kti12